jgi:hypothetical protein
MCKGIDSIPKLEGLDDKFDIHDCINYFKLSIDILFGQTQIFLYNLLIFFKLSSEIL